jgi:hypothetical protein
MKPLRLRSQLLIAALLIILGLTSSLLLFVRHTVHSEIQKSVRDGTETSVRAFETVQRQRELQLSRTAAMLADLPTLIAQMPTDSVPRKGGVLVVQRWASVSGFSAADYFRSGEHRPAIGHSGSRVSG